MKKWMSADWLPDLMTPPPHGTVADVIWQGNNSDSLTALEPTDLFIRLYFITGLNLPNKSSVELVLNGLYCLWHYRSRSSGGRGEFS